MHAVSPPESIHTLSLDALRHDDITFWSLWSGEDVVGCIALRALNPRHGEIKSMRTADKYRQKGAAARLLQHLEHEALSRGYEELSLETGTMPYFNAARAFYLKHGFVEVAPFEPYQPDPNSVFYSKTLR